MQEKTFGAEGERTKELPVESRRWTKAELHAKSKSIRAELHAKSRSIRAELHAKSKSIRTPAEMDGGTEAAREGVAGRYELEAKGKNRSR